MTEVEIKYRISLAIISGQMIEDGVNKSTEIIYKLLNELLIIQRATQHSSLRLKEKHKISFNDWLRVNCESTRNKNLFIKGEKAYLRGELIEMYEKE